MVAHWSGKQIPLLIVNFHIKYSEPRRQLSSRPKTWNKACDLKGSESMETLKYWKEDYSNLPSSCPWLPEASGPSLTCLYLWLIGVTRCLQMPWYCPGSCWFTGCDEWIVAGLLPAATCALVPQVVPGPQLKMSVLAQTINYLVVVAIAPIGCVHFPLVSLVKVSIHLDKGTGYYCCDVISLAPCTKPRSIQFCTCHHNHHRLAKCP